MTDILSESNMNIENSRSAIETAEQKAGCVTMKKESEYYSISEDYWKTQPATIDGMLGGYECVNDADIEQSQKFLNIFFKQKNLGKHLALDCGAGIGRITKNLLLKNFEHVEMVDPTDDFINAATEFIGPEDVTRVSKFHTCGLQDFIPQENTYDLIWIQWVIGYVKDEDLVDFFKRCKLALKPTGVIVVKDNLSNNEAEFDEEDNCVTRTKKEFMNLIHKSGMHVIRDERQKKFPANLYEVRMFAFK